MLAEKRAFLGGKINQIRRPFVGGFFMKKRKAKKKKVTSIVTSAQRLLKELTIDFETTNPLHLQNMYDNMAANQLIADALSESVQQASWAAAEPAPVWGWSSFQTPATVAHPGLTTLRRVVLDLTYRGYGLSSQMVAKDGDLLGIAAPEARFDIVGGATVVQMSLGEAIIKLRSEAARFDLIVCDIPFGATTPQVGIFAPPPAPLAQTGRKLILPGMVETKPKEVGITDLALGIGPVVEELLSDNGEALLRIHVITFNKLCKQKAPFLDHVWFTYLEGEYTVLYMAKNYTNSLPLATTLGHRRPSRDDRPVRIKQFNWSWTEGQTQSFRKLLLNS